MTSSNLLRTLDVIDRALLDQERDLARDRAARFAKRAEARIRQAMPVLGTDWDGTPIADPSAPDLCENR